MNEQITPATELAQSLRAQGFATAEARQNVEGGMYVELTTDADGLAKLQKRGYDVQLAKGKVRVFCPIPERFW